VAILCPKCQSPNLDDSVYCRKCATRLGALEGPPPMSLTKTIVAPEESQLRPGSLIAHRYKILEILGRGGMGIVYKAEDTRLKRSVAIKFLPPELGFDKEVKARFVQEARAAAALSHPHISTIYEIDNEADPPYITMEYIDGQTLRERIFAGPLEPDEVLNLAVQVADGLKEAHARGIIHRDIKSANIMVTAKGQAKIMDFGLAKMTGEALITKEAKTMGTVAYMSPEQVRGEDVDRRTDIWSLGVVLYEVLTGRLPFGAQREDSVMYAIVHEEPKPLRVFRPNVAPEVEKIVRRSLEKKQEDRYQSALEMLDDLQRYLEKRRAEEVGIFNLRTLWKRLRRPRVAVPTAAIIVSLALLAVWFFNRRARIRWAREFALPNIHRLLDENAAFFGPLSTPEAFNLAEKAAKILPNNPDLETLWPRLSVVTSVHTEPEGAAVYIKKYSSPQEEWRFLGITPLEKIRLPACTFSWKLEKDGYETFLGILPFFRPNPPDTFFSPIVVNKMLNTLGTVPSGMIRIDEQEIMIGDKTYELDDFFIDRYEVTNRQFKEFVDAGGYAKKEYWKHDFIKNGQRLTWDAAIGEFLDQTARPGPATWQAGNYPPGEDDFPVSGISWYEAAAYAEFAGKSLPTIWHWEAAAGLNPRVFAELHHHHLIPLSNIGNEQVARVGTFKGMTPYGAYDMAGNAREWCWNEGPQGRFLRGGAWDDQYYLVASPLLIDPFSRSPRNGVRCAKYVDESRIPGEVFKKNEPPLFRNFETEKPVSDEVFEVYKRLYAYDRKGLDATVESREESAEGWIKEKVTFTAAYDSDRVKVNLFLPKNGRPPYQTVIYWSGATGGAPPEASEHLEKILSWFKQFDFLMSSGRAVVWPIYFGTFERRRDPASPQGPRTKIEMQVKQINDLRRTIDYLETRPDIDAQKVAFLGYSWGGRMGTRVPAVEERIKANILICGGLWYGVKEEMPSEIDDLNYVTRVKVPTLLLGGKYDSIYTPESSLKPTLRLLGTPEKDKDIKVFESDHFVPRNDLIRECLAWLDKYLGPAR
jgi:serine/threonine protein kinase/dienelactone hydrolase